ncbi:hypothetical protein [Enterococcus lactis]|uniref:hypothetical protein n=1 Tax=Enterococcus lactis TaxID=357441 RepID=UPI004042366E
MNCKKIVAGLMLSTIVLSTFNQTNMIVNAEVNLNETTTLSSNIERKNSNLLINSNNLYVDNLTQPFEIDATFQLATKWKVHHYYNHSYMITNQLSNNFNPIFNGTTYTNFQIKNGQKGPIITSSGANDNSSSVGCQVSVSVVPKRTYHVRASLNPFNLGAEAWYSAFIFSGDSLQNGTQISNTSVVNSNIYDKSFKASSTNVGLQVGVSYGSLNPEITEFKMTYASQI